MKKIAKNKHGGYMKKTEKGPVVLTVTEKYVLDLLKQGVEEEEIASRLNISHHTVKSHKSKLLQLKLL